MALCHSIIVEKKEGQIIFNASSPDELALVNAAKLFGAEFIERDDENYLHIMYKDQDYKFKLLHLCEFNSTRKRMSVLIRDNDGKIKLICKGADSIILKRINKIKSESVEKKITHNLEEFGKKGLRTLMIAERELKEDEYKLFLKSYYRAISSLEKKDEKVDACYEILEQDLVLLGVTAIEDCLQDDLSKFISNKIRTYFKSF